MRIPTKNGIDWNNSIFPQPELTEKHNVAKAMRWIFHPENFCYSCHHPKPLTRLNIYGKITKYCQYCGVQFVESYWISISKMNSYGVPNSWLDAKLIYNDMPEYQDDTNHFDDSD